MRTELTTQNGIKVTNVQKSGDYIVGTVNGKAMVWDTKGRRNPKNRSKLDLNLNTKHYVAIRKWGTSYKSNVYTTKPTGRCIVKVIEVEI